MQPIDDRIEFQGNDYNRKNPQVKEFHFYLTPNSNFCSILVIKLEDLKVLRRSPDLLYNAKIGQGQLQLILFTIYGGCSHFGQVT